MTNQDRRSSARRTDRRRLGTFDRWGQKLRVRGCKHGVICHATMLSFVGSELLAYFDDGMHPDVGETVDVLIQRSKRVLRAEIRQINLDSDGGSVAKLSLINDGRLADRRARTARRRSHDRIAA